MEILQIDEKITTVFRAIISIKESMIRMNHATFKRYFKTLIKPPSNTPINLKEIRVFESIIIIKASSILIVAPSFKRKVQKFLKVNPNTRIINPNYLVKIR